MDKIKSISRMKNFETINFYCFNSGCNNSIFRSTIFCGVRIPIDKAFSQTYYCKTCQTELISKPGLEIKAQINKAIHIPVALQAIVIDDDPFFHMVAERSLAQDLSITKARYNYNGADAINYLKAHKNLKDYLPDLIFVDINMPVMDGWGFLEEYEKLYAELDKKSKVYVTSGYIDASHKMRARKYSFVKGLIPKPFRMDTLKHLYKDTVPVN